MINLQEIKKLVEIEFQKLNAEIEAELYILRPPSQSTHSPSSFADITKFNLIRDHAILEINDVDFIAQEILNFASTLDQPHYFKKSDTLTNAFHIDLDPNCNIRVLIKSRIQASNSTSELMGTGSFKAVKLYGLLMTFSLDGDLIPEYTGRVITISRKSERSGNYQKLTRAQKNSQFNTPYDAHNPNSTFANELKEEGFGYIPIEDGFIYFKPYSGLSMYTVQMAMAKRGEKLPHDFTESLIYCYLFSLFIQIKSHIWPSDLKQDNTCFKINPVSREIDSVHIIDYDSCTYTYTMDFKQAGNDSSGVQYIQILSALRNPNQRRNLTAVQMSILKRQLMIEILHMCIIFRLFPSVFDIHELHYSIPFNKIDFGENTASIFHPTYGMYYNFLKDFTDPAVTFLFNLSQLNPTDPFSFKEFLFEIRKVCSAAPGVYIDGFTDVWIEEFGNCVDNFLPDILAVDEIFRRIPEIEALKRRNYKPERAMSVPVTRVKSEIFPRIMPRSKTQNFPSLVAANINPASHSSIRPSHDTSHVLSVPSVRVSSHVDDQERYFSQVSACLSGPFSEDQRGLGTPQPINAPRISRIRSPHNSLERPPVPSRISTPPTSPRVSQPLTPPRISTPLISERTSPLLRATPQRETTPPSRTPTPKPNIPALSTFLLDQSKPSFLPSDSAVVVTNPDEFVNLRSPDAAPAGVISVPSTVTGIPRNQSPAYNSALSPIPPLPAGVRPPMLSPAGTPPSPAPDVRPVEPSTPFVILPKRSPPKRRG